MTRTVAVLLGTGSVALVIGIVVLIQIINGNGDGPPPIRSVKIIAPKGTQVFERLPNESEQSLGKAPLTVDVVVDATIILRYKEQEKIYPPEKWKGIKLIEDFGRKDKRPPPSPVVTVSINAVPWAEVFIRLPDSDRFIKPPGKKSNVTPIRGGLKIPVGTAIRLVYGDKEQDFGYEAWKTSNTISHVFFQPK